MKKINRILLVTLAFIMLISSLPAYADEDYGAPSPSPSPSYQKTTDQLTEVAAFSVSAETEEKIYAEAEVEPEIIVQPEDKKKSNEELETETEAEQTDEETEKPETVSAEKAFENAEPLPAQNAETEGDSSSSMIVDDAEDSSVRADVIYSVIIKTENNQFYRGFTRDMVQEILAAIGFLYPDYMRVKMNVFAYRLKKTNRDDRMFTKLASGIISDHWTDLLPDSFDFDALEEVDIAKYIQQSDRVLVIGKFDNIDGEKFRKMFLGKTETQKWLNLLVDVKESVEEDPQLPVYQVQNTVKTAFDIFTSFESKNFPHKISLTQSRDQDYRLEFPDDTLACHVIITENKSNVGGKQENVIDFPDMQLITIKCDGQDGSLQLENNGLEKTLLVCYSLNPFSAEYHADAGKSYSIQDQPVVSVSITKKEEENEQGIIIAPEEWKASLTRIDESGIIDLPLVQEEMTYTHQMDFKAFDTGEYAYEFKVWNEKHSEFHWEKTFTVQVEDKAPWLKDEAMPFNGKTEEYYLDAPIQLNLSETRFDLEPIFDDDGGTSGLTYFIDSADVPGITINGYYLEIEPEKMPEGLTEIQIKAMDQHEHISEQAYPMAFKIKRVKQYIQADTKAEFFIESSKKKGDKLSVGAQISYPEEIEEYILHLNDEQMYALQAQYIVKVQIDSEEPYQLLADKNILHRDVVSYQDVFTLPLKTGEHNVRFTVVFKYEDQEILLKEENKQFQIENQPPVMIDKPEQDIALEIPGPWILQGGIRQTEEKRHLDQMIRTEPLDEITVTVIGDNLHLTSKEGSTFIISDQDNADIGNTIVWDTVNDQEAPTLLFKTEKRGDGVVTLEIEDQDKAKADPVTFRISTRYHDEAGLNLKGIIIVAAILLLILTLVLIRVLKPKFKKEHMIVVSLGNYERVLCLEKWKKNVVSIEELLVYCEVPAWKDLLTNNINHLFLKPGGQKCAAYLLNAKKIGVDVYINSRLEESNRIPLSHDNVAEIYLFSKEPYVSLPDEPLVIRFQ